MILKFCYKNEIRRCSELPKDYESLLLFLQNTFKSDLPKNFRLHYLLPESDQETSLNSQQTYETLLKTESLKAAKVFITEVSEEDQDHLGVSGYDVISKEVEQQEKPSLEEIVKNVAESVVVPQVQKLPYFSYMPMQDEQIQRMVRDAIKDQIPTIVSRVKDAVLQELRPLILAQGNQPVAGEQREVPKNVVIEEVQHLEDNRPLQAEEQKAEGVANDIKIPKNHKRDLLDRIKKIGTALKELPEKAKTALDDWSHKIEGDAYVQIEEGKYPKSVVEKADLLKEVFIDESRKELLEFVKKYPRSVPIEQLAHLYIVRNQVEEERAVEAGQDQGQVAEGQENQENQEIKEH